MADDDLIELARGARERAHAPYSKFAMGAAVRTADGQRFAGTLVENVSLGLAMCAERVAMFSAVAAGAGAVTELVLVAPRTDDEVTLPCGACLQVARELGSEDLAVTACDLDGTTVSHTLRELAPLLPSKR
jgi:cytidine deaminase